MSCKYVGKMDLKHYQTWIQRLVLKKMCTSTSLGYDDYIFQVKNGKRESNSKHGAGELNSTRLFVLVLHINDDGHFLVWKNVTWPC